MAIIYSYPLATPELTDLVVGTQVGSGNPTKTFTIQSIADLTSGVKKIIAGTDISISPTEGTGEVTINCTLDPGVKSIIAGANISLSPASGVGDVNISVTGVVTGVTSGNADTITIGGTAAAPTVAANTTATILSGGLNLATAGTIYNFVTTGVNARIQNITNPVDAQDVATKSYVDQLTAGGVTFKGGFNATTGVIDGGTDNLTTGATRVAVDVGDLYVVTTAGDFYGDATVPLAIGDQVYAQTAAVVGASVIADWITIESNIVPASAGATDGATTKGVSGFDNQMFAATADGFITSTTLNEIPITVQNVGGSNYYFVDGTQQSTITLLPDVTYLINVSDLTVNNHPFILTETSGGGSGATAYTTGVIYLVNNAPVNQTDWESSFSSTTTRKLRVTLTQTAPILYYGCAVHANMGASISQGGEVTSVTTTDGTFVNLTPDAPAVGAVTVTADLSATGTTDSTTFLRGDNTWAVPPVIDNYVDGIAFDTATGVLTLDRTGSLTDLTQDLDGRYALSSDIPASITQTVTTTNGTFINLTPTSPTSGAVTVTADLSASGTPSSSNFLAGDNSWTTALTSVGLTSTASTIVIGSSPLTANGTMNVDLASSGVTPGSYTNADITVDTYGRITVAGNGSGGGGTVTSVTSADTNTITVANTTTTPAITAVTAAVASGSTALVTSGDVYSYVNTNAPGTVTSIGFDVSAYNAFSITPSTAISTNGTFTLGINGGSAGQFLDYTGNWSTPSGNISGTGTANKVPLWTTSTNLGDSVIAQDGTNIGIGTTSPSTKLDVSGDVTATTFLGELTGTINTATTAVTQANATNNTTVATTAYVDSMIGTIPAGLVFQGAWNASTNTPTLTSGSGTTGHFYIVSVAGSTNLDGITDWQVGDWAVFVEQGATDQWEKIDNSSVLDGAGVAGQIAYWSSTSQLAGNANLFFDSTNNRVGIGTTSPSQELVVIGNIGTSGSVFFDDNQGINFGNSNAKIYGSSADGIKFNGTGSEKMRLTQAGNLGIGTDSPSHKLTVNSSNNTTGFGLDFTTSNVIKARFDFSSFSTSGYQTLFNMDDTGLDIGHDANRQINLKTNNADRLTITGTGNVGIGTTSPVQKFTVAGNIDIAGGDGSLLTFNNGDASIIINNNGSGRDLSFKTYDGSSTAERMRIGKTGQVQFNNYTSSSSFTGTAAANLAVDSSGNIITEASGGGGTISGSGTTNKIPKFTGSTAIGDSIIDQPNATDVTIANSTSDQVGIRTAFPNSALHVEGNIKTTSVNASEQGFFAPGNLPYIKQGAYGKGNFFSKSEDGNLPTMFGAYSPTGKLVEGKKAIIVRVPPGAWPSANGGGGNAFTSIQLVSFKSSSIIMDVRVTAVIKTKLNGSASWGSNNYPIQLIMYGQDNIPNIFQNYTVIGTIPKEVLTTVPIPAGTGPGAGQENLYRYYQIPIGIKQANTVPGISTTPFWFASKSTDTYAHATSLRLQLDGTTSIQSNVANDCYFYVEYTAFNFENFTKNFTKSAISPNQGSGATNMRSSFFTSAKQTAQSDVCTPATPLATTVKKWHNGRNTFPVVGDRVFNANSSTGYPTGNAAGNGYYYLYSAGGKRYWMQIQGTAGTSTPPGSVAQMTACIIPAPTS